MDTKFPTCQQIYQSRRVGYSSLFSLPYFVLGSLAWASLPALRTTPLSCMQWVDGKRCFTAASAYSQGDEVQYCVDFAHRNALHVV